MVEYRRRLMNKTLTIKVSLCHPRSCAFAMWRDSRFAGDVEFIF